MKVFYAAGWGGQKILIIPEVKTVIVFTGGTYVSQVREFRILRNYVLRAIE
jgi:hypothetical protein